MVAAEFCFASVGRLERMAIKRNLMIATSVLGTTRSTEAINEPLSPTPVKVIHP